MISILHISDIHFDEKDPYSLASQIENEIEEKHLKINLILCTGDFVNKSINFKHAVSQFKTLLERLSIEEEDILFIPGNHELLDVKSTYEETNGEDFLRYHKFLHDFYKHNSLKAIYGESYADKFKKDDFSFHKSINDEILISGFHVMNKKRHIVAGDILNSVPESDIPIKIAMIHEAIYPLLDLSTVDLLENAGLFTRSLSKKRYRLFLTGHAHRLEVNLINNDYLNVAVGCFKINKDERSYNVITVDGSDVILQSYYSDKHASSEYKPISEEKNFEVLAKGIFPILYPEKYTINLNELSKLQNSKSITRSFQLISDLTNYTIDQLRILNNIQISKNTLLCLSTLLKTQPDTLIKQLQDNTWLDNSEVIYQGQKGENEIYIKNLNEDNIITDNFMKKILDIKIYDVEFRQLDKETNLIKEKPGKYITIKPSSGKHGAVVLPIDDKGRVLLVNQFRHSTAERKFFTEAIRGFSNFSDDGPLVTALREFSEEGGGPSIGEIKSKDLYDILLNINLSKSYIDLSEKENLSIKRIFLLRSLYADTGKLWEAPSFFLFHANHDLQNENIIRKDPIMESPFWVSLKYVLKSIVDNCPIQLAEDEIEDAFKKKNQKGNKFLYRDPLITQNKIYIEDAFTSQVVFLSLPKLKYFLRAELVEDIYSVLI